MQPNHITFNCLLAGCADNNNLVWGKQLHQDIIQQGIKPDIMLQTSLINMYGSCKELHTAMALFDQLKELDMTPTSTTFTCLLTACAELEDIQSGKKIHEDIIKSNVEQNITLRTALINMYGQCKDVNTAFELYEEMKQLGMKPNSVTFTCLITACAKTGKLDLGRKLHREIIASKIDITIPLKCSLVMFYAKCDDSPTALRLLKETIENDLQKNEIMYTCLLNLCADLVNYKFGKQIHCHLLNTGINLTERLQCVLGCFYARCGEMENAMLIFSRLQRAFSKLTVATWNSIIAHTGHDGQGKMALQYFEEMLLSGVFPDSITFVSVLNACSHSGLCEEALYYFNLMKKYSIVPQTKHFNSLVDTLSRSGKFDEAEKILKSMEGYIDHVTWATILGAARTHKNVKLAEHAAKQSLKLNPTDPATYVLLGNTYAQAGLYEKAAKVRSEMAQKRINKIPGRSCIEIDGVVTCFTVGDKSHPQWNEIYAKLQELRLKLKQAGFRPDTSWVLQNVSKEEKESSLCFHRYVCNQTSKLYLSEKIAIAFGLINTPPGTKLTIIKNLRICGNCHAATAMISKLENRAISVRDTNRWHHFTVRVDDINSVLIKIRMDSAPVKDLVKKKLLELDKMKYI